MAKVSAQTEPASVPRGAARATPPRAYLRSEQRRRQLLDAAARIAGSEGVERLTIVGLARAAGVSRQLVYDHFSDLQGLVAAVLEDRFAAIDDAIYETISRPGAFDSLDDAIEVALGAARAYLELSREDRHILRSVLTATDAPAHELNELALQLRNRSIRRWQPAVGDETGPVTRARAWALANALNGLGDLVGTGELDVESALDEFAVLLRASVTAAAPHARS
jgi:AcrR family transcriptional regulator